MTTIKTILFFISMLFLFSAIYNTYLKVYYLRLVKIRKIKDFSVNFIAEIIFFTIFATLQYIILII